MILWFIYFYFYFYNQISKCQFFDGNNFLLKYRKNGDIKVFFKIMYLNAINFIFVLSKIYQLKFQNNKTIYNIIEREKMLNHTYSEFSLYGLFFIEFSIVRNKNRITKELAPEFKNVPTPAVYSSKLLICINQSVKGIDNQLFHQQDNVNLLVIKNEITNLLVGI